MWNTRGQGCQGHLQRSVLGRGGYIYDLNISGVSRVSKIFEQNQDVCVIGQVILIILLLLLFIYHLFIQLMEWPIARGINGDEKVDIQILAHNRYKHQIKWKIRFVITGF